MRGHRAVRVPAPRGDVPLIGNRVHLEEDGDALQCCDEDDDCICLSSRACLMISTVLAVVVLGLVR